MFYIDQLCIPSFPIELVKTESGFLFISVQTGLGRWTLGVAVISVDALLFCFLRRDLSPWGYGNRCFLVLSDSKETDLVSSNQEASPSAGKWVLSEGHKNYFKDWCLMNSQPTFPFLTNLNLMNDDHIIKSMYTR